ncbi:MAG: thiol:disulfide interchange protein DsbA/DsbL [Proteobacteria bacterium]|nr:thiol:disulfide interchange protein DsbA/DsbL [Pseudomonadota bacterium]
MIRFLALASVVLLLSACAQKEPPAAPPAPPPVTQENPPPPPPAEASAQSETEQATHSQESADGAADAEHTASDTSLEKIAAAPAAALPPGKWQSGVNYNLLVPAQPTSVGPGKVEVTEVFWLACPHCYALEPFLKSWLKSKPGYVEFVRVPVMWQPMHKAHAKLYYTLAALGRDDLVSKAFELAASRHELLVGDSDEGTFKLQQQFATSNGVSADDFAKAFNSFSVNANLQRATEVTQRYQVQGVPFVIVNGKYTTDVAMAGGEAKLIELINDLTAAEHHH